MIALQSVASRNAPLSRSNLTVEWGAGLHAVVGTTADGGPLLLGLLAGRERARTGRVRVLEQPPDHPDVARRIALVPMGVVLPEALRVDEVFALAAALRGEERLPAAVRLAALGIESLARQPVRSLGRDEARAVAMAEALTSTVVQVLLVDEPLMTVDPRAAARLPEFLRAWCGRQKVLVFATASMRDTREIADDHVFMQQGAPLARGASLDALAALGPSGSRMRILSSDPLALVAALARQPEIEAVARHDGIVIARGRQATALAQAVGRAVVASGVDVLEMRMDVPTLEHARATAAHVGDDAGDGAHDAARPRTAGTFAVPGATS